jgi:N-acetylglucosaminyldiphosphoundecaprenol N-acetyl-beta-D-mannosaminyltransferase
MGARYQQENGAQSSNSARLEELARAERGLWAPDVPIARAPIAILGVPFDNVTMAEAVEQIEAMIVSRRPHYVVTANVDFLVQARHDVELRHIIAGADLVLCDGTPVAWASRLLGNRLAERVAGADLAPVMIRTAAAKGYRVFFLGATPESTSKAVARLRAQFPGLVIAGHYSPPFRPLLEMDHETIRRHVLAAQPDLVLVAFGCPKQEKWMGMHYRALGVPVTIGVGATIDFLAGQVRRAPVWMQRHGVEWVFRLAQEPRRLFKRYFKDLFGFSWGLLQQWILLQAPGLIANRTFRPDPSPRSSSILNGRDCLDLSGVDGLDSTAIGQLIRREKQLRDSGRRLILLAPNPKVQRALSVMRLTDLFLTAPNQAAAELLIATGACQGKVVTVNGEAAGPSLAWQGEVTATNAQTVWEQTRARFEAVEGLTSWRIDLSGVDFIDTTGLGLMVRLKEWARREGIDLAFTRLQPSVLNVLDLARLRNFLVGPSNVDFSH